MQREQFLKMCTVWIDPSLLKCHQSYLRERERERGEGEGEGEGIYFLTFLSLIRTSNELTRFLRDCYVVTHRGTFLFFLVVTYYVLRELVQDMILTK